MILASYDFSKLSLAIDGANSMLSDMDFYNAIRSSIAKTNQISYDLLPGYYRKNTFIAKFQSYFASVIELYMTCLEWLMKQFGQKINYKGSFVALLDQIRASLIGRLQYPHQHFMNAGVQSISLVSHGRQADHYRSKDHTRDMIWILEKLVRIHDQLDEQLHAGYYFYILTSPGKFISNAGYLWPIVLMAYGACLPIWFDYISLTERQNITEWDSRKQAGLFMILNFTLGAVVFMLP